MKIKTVVCFLSFLSTMAVALAQLPAPVLIDKWPGEANAHDGIGTNNGAMSNVTFAPGQVGQAFVFDGTGSIDFGDVAGTWGASDFTLNFWVQTTLTDQNIFGFQSSDPATGLFTCQMSDGKIVFTLADNLSSGSVSSRDRVNDGFMHHVAIVRHSVELRVYIDGVLSALATANGTIALSGTSVFLFDADTSTYMTNVASLVVGTEFTGLLDEIEIYNGALDASEIYMLVHPDTLLAILDQPVNLRALEGRGVVFEVGAVGVGPISYQWQLNGMAIPGATDATLAIDNPQFYDAGTYSVVVSNPSGSLTSSEASLVVTVSHANSPSPFARWSAEGTANDSIGGYHGLMSNVSFASGVLGYAFRFNGTSFIDFGKQVGNFGTNDFSVDFWMQTKFQGYQEAVIGKRAVCDGGTMWEFRLSVPRNFLGFCALQDASSVVSSLSSLGPVRMNDGVFHHVAETRKGNIYKMYIDGHLVSSSAVSEIFDLRNGVSFMMGMNPCDGVDGTVHYNGLLDEVEMFNRTLSDSEVYSLYQPDPALTVLTPPRHSAIIESNDITLSVTVAGRPPYSYQWRFNGADVNGATSSELTIDEAKLSDAGVYQVVVSNSSETTTSSGAHLTVVPATDVIPGLVNKWSGEGDGDDLMGNSSVSSLNVHFSAGAIGQGFHFDGADEYIVFDKTTGNFGTNDFTIDFWVRNSGGISWNQLLVGKYGLYSAFIGTDGILRFTLRDNSTNSCALASPAIVADNVFHHAAIVRESTNLSLYLDGLSVAQTNASAIHTVSNNFYFYMGWMGMDVLLIASKINWMKLKSITGL